MKKLLLSTLLSLNFIMSAYAAQQMQPMPSLPPMPPLPSMPPSTQQAQPMMPPMPPAQPMAVMPAMMPAPQAFTSPAVSRPVQTTPPQPTKSVQETIKSGALLIGENDPALLKTTDPEVKQWFALSQESLKKVGAIIVTIDDRLQKIRDSMRSIDQQVGATALENSTILGEVKDTYTMLKRSPLTPALTQTIAAEEAKAAQADKDIAAMYALKTKLLSIQNDINKKQTLLLQQLSQARTATYAILTADKATAQMQHNSVVQINQEIMLLQNEIIQKQLPSFESTAQELNQKMSALQSNIQSLQQQARQLDQKPKTDTPEQESVTTSTDNIVTTTQEPAKKRQRKKPAHGTFGYVKEIASSAASLAFDCVHMTTNVVISMFEKPDAPSPQRKGGKKTTTQKEPSIFRGLFWKTLHVAHNITSKVLSTGASIAQSLYEKFLSSPQEKQTGKKKNKKKVLSTPQPLPQAPADQSINPLPENRPQEQPVQENAPVAQPNLPQEAPVELKTEPSSLDAQENIEISSHDGAVPQP